MWAPIPLLQPWLVQDLQCSITEARQNLPWCPMSWPKDAPAMGPAPTLPPASLDTAPDWQDEALELWSP